MSNDHFVIRAGARVLAVALFGLSIAPVAWAAQGDLDPGFGGGSGVVVTDVGPNLLGASGVAVQADGKPVVVSYIGPQNAFDFLVVRYAVDGTLDPSFGSSGLVSTDFGGGDDIALDVAVQADGKIVVAGSASVAGEDRAAVARYGTSGALDPSFDLDGRATTPGVARGVALQANGRIEVGGGNGFATFEPNGNLLYFGSALIAARDVAAQPDGKVVAAGTYQPAPAADLEFAVTRFNDSSFGEGGLMALDLGPFDDIAEAIAVQPDGRIVVAGHTANCDGECYQPVLARFLADGALDASFGTGGMVDFGGSGGAGGALYGVAIQEDGRIVAAGSDLVDRFLVARVRADGSLDTSFGGTGIVTTFIAGAGGHDQAADLALQADGRIVVAGRHLPADVASEQIAVARYLGSPCDGPRPGCRAAGSSALAIRNAADDGKDQLLWKWLKGPATSPADFGDPTGTTAYHLCLYAGTANAVLADVAVGYGAGRWSLISDKGYKYKNPAGAISKMNLKGGADGKAKILLKGTGPGLPDPILGALPAPITAQLIATTNGTCFEAVYGPGDIGRNDATQLKAKMR